MKNIISLLLILPIKIYQKTISRLLPCTCRFQPSCSNYAIEAINIHGPIKGLYLGMIRILKCNPFFRSGSDKVPRGVEN